MKQISRLQVFETNSSTYHTLTIQTINPKITGREIVKGQDLIINNAQIAKSQFPSWSESYRSTARSTYEKAQLVLRFMGYELEEQLDALVDKKEYTDIQGNWLHEKRDQLLKAQFYNTPFIKAFVKAIKRYIGEEHNVIIEFNNDWTPYIQTVSDESKYFHELFMITKEDLTNVELLADRFYNVIFNPEIEMIEECESNE